MSFFASSVSRSDLAASVNSEWLWCERLCLSTLDNAVSTMLSQMKFWKCVYRHLVSSKPLTTLSTRLFADGVILGSLLTALKASSRSTSNVSVGEEGAIVEGKWIQAMSALVVISPLSNFGSNVSRRVARVRDLWRLAWMRSSIG